MNPFEHLVPVQASEQPTPAYDLELCLTPLGPCARSRGNSLRDVAIGLAIGSALLLVIGAR